MTTSEKWIIFITAAQAIATFAAVVVALWQTKYANRKRLKITVCGSIIHDGVSTKECLCVNVVNVGNRDVTIRDCDIKIDNNEKLVFMDVIKKLPIDIPVEKNESILIPLDMLRTAIRGSLDKIKNKNKKVPICVYDGVGKKYFVKANKTFLQYICNTKE